MINVYFFIKKNKAGNEFVRCSTHETLKVDKTKLKDGENYNKDNWKINSTGTKETMEDWQKSQNWIFRGENEI